VATTAAVLCVPSVRDFRLDQVASDKPTGQAAALSGEAA
jgi:hypothetical protein